MPHLKPLLLTALLSVSPALAVVIYPSDPHLCPPRPGEYSAGAISGPLIPTCPGCWLTPDGQAIRPDLQPLPADPAREVLTASLSTPSRPSAAPTLVSLIHSTSPVPVNTLEPWAILLRRPRPDLPCLPMIAESAERA